MFHGELDLVLCYLPGGNTVERFELFYCIVMKNGSENNVPVLLENALL